MTLHSVTHSLLWYVARSSGFVAWATLAAAMIWGLLMTTRLLGSKARPAWMLDLHRYLGALAVVFTVVHVSALIFDTYARIGVISAFVPFADSRTTVPLAFGIVAAYFLVAVELTSLLRRHLSRPVWRGVHQLSFLLFVFSTVHGLAQGTDARNIFALITGGLVFLAVLVLVAFRLDDVIQSANGTA